MYYNLDSLFINCRNGIFRNTSSMFDPFKYFNFNIFKFTVGKEFQFAS